MTSFSLPKTGFSIGYFVSDFAEQSFVKGLIQRILHESQLDNENLNISKIVYEEVLTLDSNILDVSGPKEDLTGSTLLAAVLHKGRYLTVANVGDSRGVICDEMGSAFNLTVEHKPNNEKEKQRIEAAGGWVSWFGVWRVAGILATSRAIGDGQLKKMGFLTATPDIHTIDLFQWKARFLILASDGLWDVVGATEACEVVKKALMTRKDSSMGAKDLIELALKRLSMDNISAIVISFSNLKYSND